MRPKKKTYIAGENAVYNSIQTAYRKGALDGSSVVIQFRGAKGGAVVCRPSKNGGLPIINVFVKNMTNNEIDYLIKRGYSINMIMLANTQNTKQEKSSRR